MPTEDLSESERHYKPNIRYKLHKTSYSVMGLACYTAGWLTRDKEDLQEDPACSGTTVEDTVEGALSELDRNRPPLDADSARP